MADDEVELATAADRVATLTGRMKAAKLDGFRNAVMAAAGQGYTSMLRRIDPEKPTALAVEELRNLPQFRVECAAVDHGPDASHSYVVMWGRSLLQGVEGSVTGSTGLEESAVAPPVEVDDRELFDAARATASAVAGTMALLSRMKSKGGSAVRSAVMQAARQGYTCTLVRVQNGSKDLQAVQKMAATRRFETVLVSYDPGLDKDMSFLLRWGASMRACVTSAATSATTSGSAGAGAGAGTGHAVPTPAAPASATGADPPPLPADSEPEARTMFERLRQELRQES